jgi:mRNA interferase MazF
MRKRGEIWLADLNPRRGTEPGKTRRVVIIQAQALLDAEHPSTLVVPLNHAIGHALLEVLELTGD